MVLNGLKIEFKKIEFIKNLAPHQAHNNWLINGSSMCQLRSSPSFEAKSFCVCPGLVHSK